MVIRCAADYWGVATLSTVTKNGVWDVEAFGSLNKYAVRGHLIHAIRENYKRKLRHRYKTKSSATRALKQIPEIDRQFFFVTECFDLVLG